MYFIIPGRLTLDDLGFLQIQNVYGKPGTITACFFKGIIVDESALQNKPEFEVKQVKIKDSADIKNKDIGFTTDFDAMDAKIHPSTVTKIIDLNPLAVLHLHYRSGDWLTNRGFSLPILCTDKEKNEKIVNSNTIEDDSKFANDFQEIIVEQTKNIDEVSKEIPIIMKVENNKTKSKKVDIIPEKSQDIMDINVDQMKEDKIIEQANKIDETPISTKELIVIENDNIEEEKKIDEIPKVSKEIMKIENTNVEQAKKINEIPKISQELIEIDNNIEQTKQMGKTPESQEQLKPDAALT
ncbi:1088_t:CDS:2 [Funneliformis caledonium]|uniref:1088_t:CDS:1 n=1 Tax=Funneliformis caledonium TaxID=1117310 RepID=A0A9N8ZZS5_9GLOM|nr:1088_t:CDS:2 [Funneliformis caledonium]